LKIPLDASQSKPEWKCECANGIVPTGYVIVAFRSGLNYIMSELYVCFYMFLVRLALPP
jgi:hypothetical protein